MQHFFTSANDQKNSETKNATKNKQLSKLGLAAVMLSAWRSLYTSFNAGNASQRLRFDSPAEAPAIIDARPYGMKSIFPLYINQNEGGYMSLRALMSHRFNQ